MYIAVHRLNIAPEQQPALLAEMAPVHNALESKPGFRWAMVLRSLDDPSRMAAVAMWLKREDAGNADFDVQHYDVTTARGSMTPASFAALVDWQIDPAASPGFANRWNAAYHAIEDRIGSRLLQDMDEPAHYTGYHVATSEAALKADVLAAALKLDDGSEVQPHAVERFAVVSLAGE